MKHNQKRHSSLFLIELMIALLFFSVAAAVCIQLFTQSHIVSRKSSNLNEALLISEGFAEKFRASNGSMEGSVNYYDADWHECQKDSAIYTSTLSISQLKDNLLLANIVVYEDADNPLYTLEVKICP